MKGTGPPPVDWQARELDDGSWSTGAMPIGYGDPPLGTVLNDMRDSYSTVYLRRSFALPQGVSLSALSIDADWDDGS